MTTSLQPERLGDYDPSATSAPGRTIGLAALVGASLGFVLVAVLAVSAGGPFAVDSQLVTWVAQHRSDPLTSLMQIVTLGGSALAAVGVALIAVAWGVRHRDYAPARFIIATTAVAWLASQSLKILIARPRPSSSLAVGTFSSYAFPSGHATTTAALWGSVLWLLSRQSPKYRQVLYLIGWFAAMAAVDASRLELGAHWLSDVIAGSLLGTAVLSLAVVQRANQAHGRRTRPPDASLRNSQGPGISELSVRPAVRPQPRYPQVQTQDEQ